MVALPYQDKIENASPETRINRRISNLGDGYIRFSDAGLNPVVTDYTITLVTELIPDARQQKQQLLLVRDDVQWTPFDDSNERNFYIESVSVNTAGSYNAQVSFTIREKFIP